MRWDYFAIAMAFYLIGNLVGIYICGGKRK